jgi:hypothetical protein
MTVTGIAALMSSNTTRSHTLASGIVLTFNKYDLDTHADRENAILEMRGMIEPKVLELEGVLKKVKDKDIRERLLRALETSVGELIRRPGYAYYDEDIEFSNAPIGKAWQLYLATRKHSPMMTKVEDAVILLESTMPDVDRDAIQELLNWSAELEYLKNSDSPSQKVDPSLASTSEDGAASSVSLPSSDLTSSKSDE